MSFLSFWKKEEEVSLLIDIGSGSITIALVLFSKNNLPTFLYSHKGLLPIIEKLESSKLETGMAVLLDSMMTTLAKQGFTDKYWKNKTKKIEKALISFSAPWYVIKSKEVQLSEDKSFLITRGFLDSVSLSEEKIFKKEISDNIESNGKNVFTIIEKSIIHSKVNGYTLNESLGKKTKKFDAFIYMSAISKKIEDKVGDIISKHTHINRNKILMHTFPLISFSTARDSFTNCSNFLLIDITAEVSEVSFVKDDVIIANSSFPLGKNFIIRKIADAFKASPEIAQSIINMYASKKSDDITSQLVEKTLINIEEEFAVYLEDILRTLSPEMNLPTKVYLTADSDMAPIFINFLKLPKADSTSSFRKKIEITQINTEVLSRFYKSSPEIELNEFIIMLANFYSKIKNNE